MPTRKRSRHWTEILYVDRPRLFLPWMRQMRSLAQPQADGLRKIFDKHGVPRKGRVLDLAAGLGRISIRLAEAGYDVVGVDISPLHVKLAKDEATKEGVSAKSRFYLIDARKAVPILASKEERFDAVVNIGTAMGYYGEEEDERMFQRLHRIMRHGALLVVETVNRDYLVRHFQDHNVSELNGIVWHDGRRLDLETSFMRNTWRFYSKKGGSLKLIADVPVSHRVYSLHELKKLLMRAGWDYVESYGSLRELTRLTTDSFHMTLVARRH